MATAPSRSHRTASPRTGFRSFKRWWKQAALYLTFAGSLITSGPLWYDRVHAAIKGINSGSASDAENQRRLWQKNLSCSAAPFAWYNNPSNIKIDATICDSGDIFVRAITPTNGNFFRWIPLDDVMRQASGGGGLFAAQAATLSPRVSPPVPKSWPLSGIQLAQPQGHVICQHFIDDRHLLRRVQSPDGCFDELIDTLNGTVVSRKPAPCTPQC